MSPITLNTISDILDYQRECKCTQNYDPIGRMRKVVLEANADSHLPSRTITDSGGLYLDLYERFIPIAQTRDRTQLLLLGNFRFKDSAGVERIGLPDIPDPTYVSPAPTASQIIDPDYRKPKPRMIPQRLEDRTGEYWKENPEYFVFHPVAQIMVHMESNGRLVAEGAIIRCQPDPQGKHVTLLISKVTGEAFFYGGRHTITIY